MIMIVGKKGRGRLAGGAIAGGGHRNAGVAAGLENHLEIRLPNFHVLRLVARSLLALFLISLPVLGINPQPDHITAAVAAAAGGGGGVLPRHPIDDAFFLPMLLRDLRRQGLLLPGGRAVLLGQGAFSGGRLSRALKQSKMELVAGCGGGDGGCRGDVPDGTIDFIFSDGGFPDVGFVDRALKVGGVAAVRLGPYAAGTHRMGPNYKIVYVRKFGSTVAAMRKLARGDATASSGPRRRLLGVPEATKEMLSGLEDVLLEPPRFRRMPTPSRYLKKAKYLPDLTGDALESYPRRVFVEVVTAAHREAGTGAGAAEWFARNYPTRNRAFEIIKVEVETGAAGRGGAALGGADGDEEMSGWLRRNVREEEYVVMKAEAWVVEQMVGSGAAGLVDELFLECGGREGARRRAYWECLALYGKLRDAGVAVHQWWA